MKQRIYIDTSVIGGYYDEEFEEHTKRLFERIKNKDFDIYFSEVNEAELILAPQNAQDLKKIIPPDCYKYFRYLLGQGKPSGRILRGGMCERLRCFKAMGKRR